MIRLLVAVGKSFVKVLGNVTLHRAMLASRPTEISEERKFRLATELIRVISPRAAETFGEHDVYRNYNRIRASISRNIKRAERMF